MSHRKGQDGCCVCVGRAAALRLLPVSVEHVPGGALEAELATVRQLRKEGDTPGCEAVPATGGCGGRASDKLAGFDSPALGFGHHRGMCKGDDWEVPVDD